MKIAILCAVLSSVLISLPVTQSEDATCGPPPEIEHASITSSTTEENALGTTVTYACQFGFVIDGTSRISNCELAEDEEQAEWTEPQMSCIPRSCGDPGFVSNGNRIGSLFTFPNSVNFECDEGFRLVGNAKRFCRASGSWSGKLPQCETLSCESPGNPDHGRVTYTSLDFGSELKFECNTGYHLNDPEPVFCTADGTWSRTESICVEVSCEIPQKPTNGFMELIGSDGSPRAGTLAIFTCEEGLIPSGPTTSKCLDIGQWTFPAPQCLVPCEIPTVPNGRIGRYVKQRYSSTAAFKVISPGTKIEDDEKLFLHCNDGFTPLGSSKNWQEKVTCSNGKWSDKPHCEPSECRSEPPETENGRVETVDSKHGGTVYYQCLPDAKKVKMGNVTCHFGQWKGVTPICKDTRCSTNLLEFSGLQKGDKTFYKNSEELFITCDRRYTVATGNNGRMKCDNGVWKGPMPPCIAASCYSSAPSIDHGRPEVTVVAHSIFVKYVCDQYYVLVGSNRVQCLFGEWSGSPPKCEDSRCYLVNLQSSTGVSPESQAVTHTGDRISIRCVEGYIPRMTLPQCLNGVWTGYNESPCMERDCSAQYIPNGIIMEHSLGPSAWNWGTFRRERPSIFTEVPLGSIPSRRATLYQFCYEGYSFQGTSLVSARIQCSQGRWSPDPVCVLNGMRYVPTTRAPLLSSESYRFTEIKSTPSTPSHPSVLGTPASRTVPMSSLVPNEKTEPDTQTTNNSPAEDSTEEEDCSCQYSLDDENIIAYTDGKQLKFYDRVKDGSVVKFRCKEVGFHSLIGVREKVCENCQPWHSSEFPTCDDPKSGDAVILYDDNVNVAMDGALEVQKGQTMRLTCIAMEKAEFPEWRTDHQDGLTVVTERMERVGDFLYISHLDIKNPGEENEGFYECAVGENHPTVVELRVMDPYMRCLKFEDEEKFSITYDMNTRVGSQATFSCRKNEQVLNGTNVLTCLRNGEWSSPPPQCIKVGCKELKDTDLMRISYTDDHNIGSFASFHCFAPGVRSGVARTQCLENGLWAEPTPTCRTPPCSSGSLFSTLSQGVVPNMDDLNNNTMPYNSTIRLVCTGDLFPVGSPVAKCQKEGNWEVDNVHCVSGCLPLAKPSESKLIMAPDKNDYKFGDFVSFSCPPGLKLNVELEKIMCLSNGWSAEELPECVDKESDEE